MIQEGRERKKKRKIEKREEGRKEKIERGGNEW